MKKNIDRRLERLEAKRKPRIIDNLADFVRWHANPNRDPNVELSPQMEEFFPLFRSHNAEKTVYSLITQAKLLRP
jgi:hypothetical protein